MGYKRYKRLEDPLNLGRAKGFEPSTTGITIQQHPIDIIVYSSLFVLHKRYVNAIMSNNNSVIVCIELWFDNFANRSKADQCSAIREYIEELGDDLDFNMTDLHGNEFKASLTGKDSPCK